MTILGIKLTHDGAVALIDNRKLIFSIEMEKLNNAARYSEFNIKYEDVKAILEEYGYDLEKVDQVVIDGWGVWNPPDIAELTEEQKRQTYTFQWRDKTVSITTDHLAEYGHFIKASDNIFKARKFEFREWEFAYKSYPHVAGHVASAYCTSPFVASAEDSFVLVWDGAMVPQLFYVRYAESEVLNLGYLFPLIGNLYKDFAHAFRPFCLMKNDLSIAGKAMAYMAMGEVHPEILRKYREVFAELDSIAKASTMEMNMDIAVILTTHFTNKSVEFSMKHGFKHQDMLATFQEFVGELLVGYLKQTVERHSGLTRNLCMAGGCALNIKWNNNIRQSKAFKDVWVPPFPNDSGSAIGTACCEMIAQDGVQSLDWNVYSGPHIRLGDGEIRGFSERSCTLEELAGILHEHNEPVIFLNKSAELGPRALGNRSILAPAVSAGMKKRLNEMKKREDYRPVAPICIEEYAPEIFSPGTPDPFMLFEHKVRLEWKEKVPAICHLDGTARLQTVNERENEAIYRLLKFYFALSGIPLLCNTSANFNGSGFFPDIKSAMKWNRSNFIWSDNVLFMKDEYCMAHRELFDQNAFYKV